MVLPKEFLKYPSRAIEDPLKIPNGFHKGPDMRISRADLLDILKGFIRILQAAIRIPSEIPYGYPKESIRIS